MNKALIFFFVLISGIAACKKDAPENPDENPYVPTPYALHVPVGFPQPVIPGFNPTTVEGVRLGRMLFYDPILSTNGRSCSSCHKQATSFTSGTFTSPEGYSISLPPLINLAWNPDWEWKGSAAVLDHVPLADFGPVFFNSDMDSVVYKLKHHALYPQYFYEAFGVKDIATLSESELQHKIAYALIQFVRTLISDNSKFDRVMRHEEVFTPQEQNGSIIFYTERGDCFHCHGTPLLTNNTFNNTGLDSLPDGPNLGRYLVTGLNADIGKFSSPTLRNIELTGPYMHDSRFQTLEDVVEFYNSGVHWNSPNIDPIMTKPFKEYGLQLTQQEKSDLIAFLKTFTDTTILSNPAYSNPF